MLPATYAKRSESELSFSPALRTRRTQALGQGKFSFTHACRRRAAADSRPAKITLGWD